MHIFNDLILTHYVDVEAAPGPVPHGVPGLDLDPGGAKLELGRARRRQRGRSADGHGEAGIVWKKYKGKMGGIRKEIKQNVTLRYHIKNLGYTPNSHGIMYYKISIQSHGDRKSLELS